MSLIKKKCIKKSRATGEVKVQGLSNKRAKQNDPRLAWMMFHNVMKMHRHINRKEAENAASIIANISNEDDDVHSSIVDQNVNSVMVDLVDEVAKNSKENDSEVHKEKKIISEDEAKDSLAKLTKIPDDLKDIQLRPNQV